LWKRIEGVKLLDAILRKFPAPRLTAKRIVLAFLVATVADAAQIALGPVGWLAPDEVIDLIAMVLTCWLLGFHVLLLPTFVLELVPVLGMLPTWTACVAAVVALRKKEQRNEAAPLEVSAVPVESAPPQLPLPGPPRMSESSSRPADGVDANPS